MIRVLLADDHAVVRSGIRNLLEQEPDIEVVGEATDGKQALQLTKELTPDVLLLDMEMPELTGVQVARRLHQEQAPVQVLALSAYDDRQYILNLLVNGAAGYLTKEEALDRIAKAVRGVYHGEDGWLSRRAALQIIAWTQDGQLGGQELTAQEQQLMRLLVVGKSNDEMAQALGLDPLAVEKSLKKIFGKLGGTSRAKAAMRAVSRGLVQGEFDAIRVLLVDDVPLVGRMFAAALEDETGIQVAGYAKSVEEAVARLGDCDMILVNAALADDGAFRLTRTVAQHDPSVKVLIMGLSEMAPAVIRYVEAGAVGYIHQDDSLEELIKHIQAARRDTALISPRIAAALISRVAELNNWVQNGAGNSRDLDELTPREREVLQLVGQDLSNKEIADRLSIAPGTVKNHVSSIFKKLDVHNRKDAANYARLTATS